MGRFLIKRTDTGLNFWLIAGNDETIGTSEVYKSMASCKGGIKSVIANGPIAAVEDQTVEGFAKKTNPKYEIYTDKAGKPRFRLKAKNGQIVLSSEGYESKEACLGGIDSVKENAAASEIEIQA